MSTLNKYKKEWFKFSNYEPHKGQLKLHYPPNETRFIVACCGRRWGKSYSAAMEAELMVTQPNKTVWIVAPTYSTSEKIFNKVYDDLIINHKMGDFATHKSKKAQYIHFEWGSKIEGKSAEHPDGLIGEGCDLIIIDEASKINLNKIWQAYLRPTLSDKKGKAIFVSTPDGFNTFYEYFLLGQKQKHWYSFNSPSWENSHAFPDGLEDFDLAEARSTVDKEVFEQEYGSKFTVMSGRVYPEFSRETHVEEMGYNPAYPVFASIDFGFRMPACIWFQPFQHNGVTHINVIDEIIHQKNIKLDMFISMFKARPWRIVRVYGDPAGYQVQSSVGVGEADLFYQKTGHRVFSLRDRASRSIASGISHVRGFIRSADDVIRLHISKKCIGLIEDLESYRYPEHKDGTQLKNEPLKDGLHDHGADALRYGIVNHVPIKQFQIRTHKR